jgi:hypothetical protein
LIYQLFDQAAPGSAAAENTTSSGGISGWIQGGLNTLGIGTGSAAPGPKSRSVKGKNSSQYGPGTGARIQCEKENK